MKFITRTILSFIILLAGAIFLHKPVSARALTLTNVADTITTSRPSVSTPLQANQAANATQVTVFDNTSDMFLASDSAMIMPDTGETIGNNVNISNMSTVNVPAAGQRYVYFGGPCAGIGCVSNAHHAGDAVIVPITATHTIKFTTVQPIPANGFVVLTFPTVSTNNASPSASGFSFNGMTSASGLPANIQTNGITCDGTASTNVTGNTITCRTAGGVSASTTVTFIIGCTGQAGGTCNAGAYKAQLINPTKVLTAGTSDNWIVGIQTQTAALGQIDTGTAVPATIESVQVQGIVQPYITFTIAGVANGAAACNDTTNPGVGNGSTATFVNLGNLTSAAVNISAQTLAVTTNGGSWVITATSSGRLWNPATGFMLGDANGQSNNGDGHLTANDTPAPGFMNNGATVSLFGIHPCAVVAPPYTPTILGGWASGATGGGAGAKYSNPWNSSGNAFYNTVSSFSGGPSANSTTTVEYAATAPLAAPAGAYSTVITYVATLTF